MFEGLLNYDFSFFFSKTSNKWYEFVKIYFYLKRVKNTSMALNKEKNTTRNVHSKCLKQFTFALYYIFAWLITNQE